MMGPPSILLHLNTRLFICVEVQTCDTLDLNILCCALTTSRNILVAYVAFLSLSFSPFNFLFSLPSTTAGCCGRLHCFFL
uniref:Putative ovule protein n=1 Tax=Solanum chacoense TaxID=4108 RepID=A0A0V0HDL1_SOLCH